MIKKLVIVAIISAGLIAGYNLISQILEATKSGDRLSQAADLVHKLEIRNKDLKKKLEAIQTPEFIEKEARNKLGLTKKGETIVIIPDEKIRQVLGASESAQEERLPNWLGWLRLFWK